MLSGVKRKQTNVSTEKKLKVLKKLDKGENVSEISMKFGDGKNTIGGWKRKRLEIE